MAIKNLSMSIIERFMDDVQLQDFLTKYNNSRKVVGIGTNRFDFLSIIPTDKEKEMLEDYLKDDKRTMKEMAEFYGLPVQKFRDTVYNTAIRLAYQKSRSNMVGD